MARVQGNLDQGYVTRPTRKAEATPQRCLKCISDPRGHDTHRQVSNSLPGAVPRPEETPTTVTVFRDGWHELTSGLGDQISGFGCCMARKPTRQMGGGDSWS